MLPDTVAPFRLLLTLVAVASGVLNAQPSSTSSPHAFLKVQAAASLPAPLNGRLLIFLKQGSGDKEISNDEFHPEATWVAAEEVSDLKPGSSVEVNLDERAFPRPFSSLPTGEYEMQAVLDPDHSYPYSGRGPQDWISKVMSLTHWTPTSGAEPVLTLDQHPAGNPQSASVIARAMEKVKASLPKEAIAQKEELVSPLLTRFWGHPVSVRAWVILPPGYSSAPAGRYPTVYWTHGFGGNLDYCLLRGLDIRDRMEQQKMPPMIWVMLDESIAQGTHEFADSVNNGPWGAALTTEFIPYLERKYRMDAQVKGRFLNGHSSGGWATLQLQVNYPKIFGGTWSTSPDPTVFSDFTGPDLYLPNANIYKRPDGSAWPIMRDGGKVIATLEQFSKLEAVLGPYGGQISSFDWVFSPKSDSGAPEPMFDRQTGAVNPRVMAYWRDHYDLAHIVESTWAQRGADLKSRIHVIVGTADSFYLDGPAHQFEAVLKRLGADPHFTYLPGKTHFDLYIEGKDQGALFDRISAEMYAIARPGKEWKR